MHARPYGRVGSPLAASCFNAVRICRSPRLRCCFSPPLLGPLYSSVPAPAPRPVPRHQQREKAGRRGGEGSVILTSKLAMGLVEARLEVQCRLAIGETVILLTISIHPY